MMRSKDDCMHETRLYNCISLYENDCSVGHCTTLLSSSGFVADEGSYVDHESVVADAVAAADHDPETGLFQSLRVVVVRVSHRPSALVAPSIRAAGTVRLMHVPVRPLLEIVMNNDLQVGSTTQQTVMRSTPLPPPRPHPSPPPPADKVPIACLSSRGHIHYFRATTLGDSKI